MRFCDLNDSLDSGFVSRLTHVWFEDPFVDVDSGERDFEAAGDVLLPPWFLDLGKSIDRSNLAGFFLHSLPFEFAYVPTPSSLPAVLESKIFTDSTCNSGLLMTTGGSPFRSARSRAEDSDVCCEIARGDVWRS